MNGYLLSVIGTILLSAILTAIVPEGKTSATIKGIAKLACLLVIISPILKYLQTGDTESSDENSEIFFSETVIRTDEDFIKYYSEMRIRFTEEDIETELAEEFSVACDVTLEWSYETDENGTEICETDKIRITKMLVRTENVLKEEEKTPMWDYLTKNYCSEVLIE